MLHYLIGLLINLSGTKRVSLKLTLTIKMIVLIMYFRLQQYQFNVQYLRLIIV